MKRRLIGRWRRPNRAVRKLDTAHRKRSQNISPAVLDAGTVTGRGNVLGLRGADLLPADLSGDLLLTGYCLDGEPDPLDGDRFRLTTGRPREWPVTRTALSAQRDDNPAVELPAGRGGVGGHGLPLALRLGAELDRGTAQVSAQCLDHGAGSR